MKPCTGLKPRRKRLEHEEEIIGKTTVAEVSHTHDLTSSESGNRVDDAKQGMENALWAKPEDVRGPYERPLRNLQEPHGEAMLELCTR